MAHRMTNKVLSQLLVELGFERGEIAKNNHRVWRHPDSGCTLLLPDNKKLQPPREANLTGVKAQLDQQGHLDGASFDVFVASGRLPASAVGEK